jgi:hypothetical protein
VRTITCHIPWLYRLLRLACIPNCVNFAKPQGPARRVRPTSPALQALERDELDQQILFQQDTVDLRPCTASQLRSSLASAGRSLMGSPNSALWNTGLQSEHEEWRDLNSMDSDQTFSTSTNSQTFDGFRSAETGRSCETQQRLPSVSPVQRQSSGRFARSLEVAMNATSAIECTEPASATRLIHHIAGRSTYHPFAQKLRGAGATRGVRPASTKHPAQPAHCARQLLVVGTSTRL